MLPTCDGGWTRTTLDGGVSKPASSGSIASLRTGRVLTPGFASTGRPRRCCATCSRTRARLGSDSHVGSRRAAQGPGSVTEHCCARTPFELTVDVAAEIDLRVVQYHAKLSDEKYLIWTRRF